MQWKRYNSSSEIRQRNFFRLTIFTSKPGPFPCRDLLRFFLVIVPFQAGPAPNGAGRLLSLSGKPYGVTTSSGKFEEASLERKVVFELVKVMPKLATPSPLFWAWTKEVTSHS